MNDLTNDDSFQDDQTPLERIKQVDSSGNEYWSARDLVSFIGYSAWQRFAGVCRDVYSSLCINERYQTEMLPAWVTVEIGSGAVREIEDWHLSALAVERVLNRVAAHKPEALRLLNARHNAQMRIETDIGVALYEFCEQAHLPIDHQKRLQGYIFDYCIDDRLLIEIDEMRHEIEGEQILKDRIKTQVAMDVGYQLLRIKVPLRSIVKVCGVITRMLKEGDEVMVNSFSEDLAPISSITRAGVVTLEDFAIFLDHGYKGLYNGLAAEDIHRRKKLKKSQHILDHMGTTELAANLFRSTQAEDKLRRDNIQGKESANEVHYQAGVIVRRAIQEMGGTMPEDLPTPESIKKLERAEKKRLGAPGVAKKNVDPAD